MILNSDAKFKEKLTCSFKHDMRNLINFHPIKSLKISPRRALFVQSIKAWDKKIKRSYLWWHWKVVPNVSENWLVAWKMTRNFVTFHASSWKSENLHLMGSFCRKHEVLDEKVQKSYLSWHWRVMQSLKKSWLLTLGFMTNLVNFNASSRNFENLHFDVLLLSIACKVSAKKVEKNSLFVWKIKWEIWWIFTRTVKNLKICTFMGYFCQTYVMFQLKWSRQAGIYPDSSINVRFLN